MKYGRPTSDSNQPADYGHEVPNSFEVPIWRRWSAGLQVALTPPITIWSMLWLFEAVNVQEWTNTIAKGALGALALAVIFIGIPLVTYEFAFHVIFRPFYKRHFGAGISGIAAGGEGSASAEMSRKPAPTGNAQPNAHND